MAASKERSLGELEQLYQQKIKHWADQRREQAAKLAHCDQQLRAYEEKLRWVRTLITSPEGAQLPAPVKKKRRRKSPVKEVTLEVLRNRPGQWLTAKQLRTEIRRDTHKRVSLQSISVNVNLLERAGQIQRRPAPKGSGGAHYVYSAV